MSQIILLIQVFLLIGIFKFTKSYQEGTYYEREDECPLVMVYTPGFGVGVFAGMDYVNEQLLEHAIGIPFPKNALFWNDLVNYVEAMNDTHALFLHGHAAVFNHDRWGSGTAVRKMMADDWDCKLNYTNLNYGQTFSKDITFKASWEIMTGDQLFLAYGPNWFEIRNLMELEAADELVHLHDIQNQPGRIPGCGMKYTQFINNKLLAKTFIPKGTVIEISRVLLLEYSNALLPHLLGPLSEYIWYKPYNTNRINNETPYLVTKTKNTNDPYKISYDDKLQYIIILLGNGIFYNSKNIIENENSVRKSIKKMKIPNVKYDYWDITELGFESEFNYNHSKIIKNSKNQIARCATRMFIKFTAMTNIFEGEELVVDVIQDPVTLMKYPNKEFADQCM